MSKVFRAAVATMAVFSFWGAAPAGAAVVFQQRTATLTVVGKSCSDWECFDTGSNTTSATDFAPFSSSLSYLTPTYTTPASTASQTSTLSATQIQVQGRVTAESSLLGLGRSNFSVQFSLDDTESFSFTGTSDAEAHGGNSQVQLIGPNGFNLSQELQSDSAGFNAYSVSDSGLLGPGIYTLLVNLSSAGPSPSGFTFADANIELDLHPVPLPAAGLLLLSGLAPLGFMRGRRSPATLRSSDA